MFALFLLIKINAQDSVRLQIDHILAPIDKTQIPTHILRENMYSFYDLEKFDGQLNTDNSFDFSTWRMTYAQILSGATAPITSLPNFDELNTHYETAYDNGNKNVVSVALLKYANFKENAIDNNLITYNNEQFFDVPGRSQSPYETHTVFMATGVDAEAKNGYYHLLFKPNMCYSNTTNTIASIQVNFDNGAGFVTANFNTKISTNYTSIGTKNVIIKITYNNGAIYQCYNKIIVDKVPVISLNNTGRYAAAQLLPNGQPIPDLVFPATALHSGGDVFIRYSSRNSPNGFPLSRLIKPFIVIEGLDMDNTNNFNDFWEEIELTRTFFTEGISSIIPPSSNTGNFNYQLDDRGNYDLIYINYHDGVDDITRNAALLEEVINWVNAHKSPNINNQGILEQNVIMGISMGGLVSRYCLASMVKRNLNPQTRLLITHDSPHQGANVPLSIQHLGQRIRKEQIIILGIPVRLDKINKKLLKINILLNREGPAQQLLARVVDENGTVVTNNWLATTYRDMITFAPGFTPPYRMVATSQGSQCGTPLYPPHHQLVDFSAFYIGGLPTPLSLVVAKTDLKMWSMPEWGSQEKILDFKMRLGVFVKLTLFGVPLVIPVAVSWFNINVNAPGNVKSLDGVAGGIRSLKRDFNKGIKGVFPILNNLLPFSFLNLNGNIENGFSFVPITSALDVENFDNLSVPYIMPITGLNGSRFNNYIAQDPAIEPSFSVGNNSVISSNIFHTDFHARTCHFLFNEMENFANNIVCTQLQECIAPPQIFEESEECNGIKIFNITNKTSFTNIQWSVLPAGAAVIENITQNRVRVKSRHNIPYTLQVTYNFCNTVNIPIQASFINIVTETKEVEITDVSLTGATWCAYTDHQFVVNDFGEGAIYNWSLGAGLSLLSTSTDGKTIIVNYAGGATSFPTIVCNITNAYCYQDNIGSKLILNLGDVTDALLKTTYGAWQPLLSTNFVSDNHAYTKVTQPGAIPSGVTYSLASGSAVPEVWGSYATNQLQMFVYNRSAGTYNFNANIFNADCGTYTNIPFTINLSGTGGSFGYQKVFYVAPNPVSNVTSVGVNQNAPTKQFINACIAAGGNIRVEVRNFNGIATAPYIFNSSPFSTTVNNINMQTKPTGIYFFTITAQGCPNNGVYQEVHQVQKL